MNLIGGIAQLGERLNGIQEVSSSILLISTSELRLRGFPAKPFLLGGTLLHISQNACNVLRLQ